MHARDVMSLNPVTCDEDATLAEAAALLRDRGVGLLCVLRGSRLVGVVTDRHLVTEGLANDLAGDTPVSHVMQQPATVREDETIFAVLDTLRSAGMVRRVPVLDEDGDLVGVVSLSDLAAIAKDLLDGLLAEDLHNSTKNARALTGAKRIVKRIRRPAKAGRVPDAPAVRKRRPSRPGVQRNPIPRQRRGKGGSNGATVRVRAGRGRRVGET